MGIHTGKLPNTQPLGRASATLINDDMHAALSRNERLVFNLLANSSKALKAYDLLNQLHDEGLRAPMTIYRALDTLKARGLVKKVVSLNAFVAVNDDGHSKAKSQTYAFLICRGCHKVRQITIDETYVDAMFATETVAAGDVCIEAFASCESICR